MFALYIVHFFEGEQFLLNLSKGHEKQNLWLDRYEATKLCISGLRKLGPS